MLSCAIWALFLSNLIKKNDKENTVDPILGGGGGMRLLRPPWICHWSVTSHLTHILQAYRGSWRMKSPRQRCPWSWAWSGSAWRSWAWRCTWTSWSGTWRRPQSLAEPGSGSGSNKRDNVIHHHLSTCHIHYYYLAELEISRYMFLTQK